MPNLRHIAKHHRQHNTLLSLPCERESLCFKMEKSELWKEEKLMPRISLLQMDVAFGDPEANYRNAERLIRKAAAVPVKPVLLLLPELWDSAYDLERLEEVGIGRGNGCRPGWAL